MVENIYEILENISLQELEELHRIYSKRCVDACKIAIGMERMGYSGKELRSYIDDINNFTDQIVNRLYKEKI